MWPINEMDSILWQNLKRNGIKLEPWEIYDNTQTSLKDAIIIFGNGCTGSIISKDGLVLTNHHCGLPYISDLSDSANNILVNGFIAKDFKQELPCKGLKASFLMQCYDITQVFVDTSNNFLLKYSFEEKDSIIFLMKSKKEKETGLRAEIKESQDGLKFTLYLYRDFTDIRLVMAPPVSVGKFGYATDNWEWPRHTGDFALFRIYSDSINQPSTFKKNNQPYQAIKTIPINSQGIEKNMLTLVIGYPGSTRRTIMPNVLSYILETNELTKPIQVKKIEILNEHMIRSNEIYHKYAAKFSSLENQYKREIGENECIRRFNLIDRVNFVLPESYDLYYSQEVKQYWDSLSYRYNMIIENRRPSVLQQTLYNECFIKGTSYIPYLLKIRPILIQLCQTQTNEYNQKLLLNQLKDHATQFFKHFDPIPEVQLTLAMLKHYQNLYPNSELPFMIQHLNFKKDKRLEKIILKSKLLDPEIFNKSISQNKICQLYNDPLMKLTSSINDKYLEISGRHSETNQQIKEITTEISRFKRKIHKGQPDYPDADFTMRFSWGTVQPLEPSDAIYHHYQTYLEGMLDKYKTGHSEYTIPKAFVDNISLLSKQKTKIPLCFISTNDITGGNSGSPVIDNQGKLIGLVFDGNWESLGSRYFYIQEYQRCISLDIRFILFYLNYFDPSQRLIKELEISN